MPRSSTSTQERESTLILTFFVLLLFASPFTFWWASDKMHWFLPYLFWLLIILIGALVRSRYRHHDL